MAEETRKPDIEKLLPQDSQRGPLSGRLSDYLNLPESVRRAGRASGLSEAAGVEASPFVNYPRTTGVMSTLGGGAAGALLARLINRKMGLPSGMELGFLPIQGILGGVGAGLGSVVAGLTRRNEINSLKEQLKDKELNTDKIEPGSMLAALGSGIHQLGKSDVVSGDTGNKDYQRLATMARLSRELIPGMALPSTIMEGGVNAAAYSKAKEILSNKTAGFRGPMDIIPPKSLGNKGIQHVLKDLMRRKKLTKQPLPAPNEVLDRAAGYLADKGFLRKSSGLNKMIPTAPVKPVRPTAPVLPKTPAKGVVPSVYGETKNMMTNMFNHMKASDPKAKNLLTNKNFWKFMGSAPSQYGDLLTGDMKGLTKTFNRFGAGLKEGQLKEARCWEGFEPVPGKKAYSEGSCRPKTQTTKRVNEKRSENLDLAELVGAVNKIKIAEGTTTIYYASPNRQLVRIPKDAVVSTDQDIAYQMGRYYPESKETWNTKDVSGKWTGGTPQPNFRAGRMPMGRPAIYRAEVMQSDLAAISDMVKSVKKLRRSVNAVAVKQKEEK